MSRIAAMLFAILAYAIFFATFLYLIVFVGDFTFASLTVDNGPGGANLIPSIGFPGGPAWSILHRLVKSLKPVGRKMHAFGLLPWRSEKWTGTEEWLLRPAC